MNKLIAYTSEEGKRKFMVLPKDFKEFPNVTIGIHYEWTEEDVPEVIDLNRVRITRESFLVILTDLAVCMSWDTAADLLRRIINSMTSWEAERFIEQLVKKAQTKEEK